MEPDDYAIKEKEETDDTDKLKEVSNMIINLLSNYPDLDWDVNYYAEDKRFTFGVGIKTKYEPKELFALATETMERMKNDGSENNN